MSPEPTRPQLGPSFADERQDLGESIAVITAEGPITYAALDARVRDVARLLAGPRRLVLLAADNSVDALVAYLAALRGDHPVLLVSGSNPAALGFLRDAYDPDTVITTDHGCAVEELHRSPAHDLHPDLALLLSTSGSTGSPKLVRISRQNLESNAAAIAEYLTLTPDDRAITTLPMHYCYGLSVVNSHLHAGASLVLTDLSVVDRSFWYLFRSAGATSFAGVPHTFDLLDRIGFESMTLPALRYVTQAGGRMHPDKVRRYAELGQRDGWDLFVMYGQTEATARMAYLPPSCATTHPQAIGIPIPGGQLVVDAPDADGVGELVYHGDNVMLGYAEGPADLALGATLDALRTGDLGRRCDDGLFEIVGRRSRFIKPYGLRIDLDRIERLLADHGVVGACTGDDERLVVAVEAADDVATARLLVAEHLGLPASHVLVVAVAELPRLSSGKPDYHALRRLADADATTRAVRGRVTPGGRPDHRMAVGAAFAEILGAEPADDDTFVSLGGDSLSYVEMSIRLERVLGDLPRDWHTTRVGQLAPLARRRPFLAHTDTSAVIRAVAIVLVVGTHAKLWHVPGGAHTLLAVAGYNFARFGLSTSNRLASVARVAVPSMCWITVVALVSDEYGWPNALLLNGFVERPGDRWGYWFIEALVLILVLLAALLAIPAVARLGRTHPFALPVAGVALGLAVRFDLVIDLTSRHRILRPHEVFWLFALGWSAASATSRRQRLLVSAVAAIAVPGFFHDPHRELILLAGILLIVWVPTLAIPRLAQRVIAPVAGGSLYIYLTHYQVLLLLLGIHSPAVAVAGSVLIGIVAWLIARVLIERGEHLLRRAISSLCAARARGQQVSPRRFDPAIGTG